MYEVISFDLDGTLVKMDFVNHVWLERIPELYAEKYGMDVERAKKYIMDEYMKVGPEAIEWYDIHYWIDKFKLDVDWKELLMSCSSYLEMYPEVEEVLRNLSGKKLIIISNAAHEFINVEISILNLSPYFDRIFSAVSDFGKTKKDEDVYKMAMEEMGVDGSDAVHVGDNLDFDYRAAKRAGMDAYYLDREGKWNGGDDIDIVSNLAEFERRIRERRA
ncbi:MAG: HAD family hydrolase [Thermoplasmata archaeon]|nr:HAD family hydrolase [Thermoplasmata archaeon]